MQRTSGSRNRHRLAYVVFVYAGTAPLTHLQQTSHRPSEPYAPQQNVIEQNEMLEFALKAASNVLHGRFKQYGQVCALLSLSYPPALPHSRRDPRVNPMPCHGPLPPRSATPDADVPWTQLGVLAWCNEFDEMITSIKQLGFDGNMFVSTRAAALGACKEILQLELIEEVKMQIILIHLTSMIQRLRRFLDPEILYEDYPRIDFPMDPYDTPQMSTPRR
jgi:hypothetical protein